MNGKKSKFESTQIPTGKNIAKCIGSTGPTQGLRDVRVHLLYSTQQFRSNSCKSNTESWYDSVSGAVPD